VNRVECSHQAPLSCSKCDGAADDEGAIRNATPAERRVYLQEVARWRESITVSAPRPVQ
jgi:hypothetical protein